MAHGQRELMVEGSFVLTMDEKAPLIEDGAVYVQDDRIVDVGPSDVLRKKHAPRQILGGRDRLVLPGFINCHSHLEATLRRGLFDDREECVSWLERLFSWYYPQIDEDLYYNAGLLTLIEAVRTGTTTFTECGAFPGLEDVAVRVADEVGIRAIIGCMLWDVFDASTVPGVPDQMRETTDQALTRGTAFLTKHRGAANRRVLPWLCWMQVPNVSDALCLRSKEVADRFETGIMTHGAVTAAMVALTRARYGLPDIERLGRLGVLGPNLLIAHGGWLTGHELLLLKDHHVSVAHCVSSSMKGAYGSVAAGRFPEMLSMGINVCLGTDSASSSNHLDMVRQMNLAATAHKEARLDPTLVPAREAVRLATVNGARAIGRGDALGVLAPGRQADVVVMDLTHPGWMPFTRDNIVANLVYAASGASVDTVIVAGRVIVDGGRVVTVNEAEVRRRCQALFRRIVEKADWLRA